MPKEGISISYFCTFEHFIHGSYVICDFKPYKIDKSSNILLTILCVNQESHNKPMGTLDLNVIQI